MGNNIGEVLTYTFSNAVATIVTFIPRFLSGLIILVIGLIIGSFLKQGIHQLFRVLKIETWLHRYGVPESKGDATWANIVGELARWFVIILFFLPVADIWGLSKFSDVLGGLLLFLPNVFVAVLLLLVGFVISKLVSDLLLASIHGISKDSAQTVANVGRWAVLIFVFLVVLNQLGVASDLIRILFSGFVGMVALAGGLAFGLGGKNFASEVLEKLKSKM